MGTDELETITFPVMVHLSSVHCKYGPFLVNGMKLAAISSALSKPIKTCGIFRRVGRQCVYCLHSGQRSKICSSETICGPRGSIEAA